MGAIFSRDTTLLCCCVVVLLGPEALTDVSRVASRRVTSRPIVSEEAAVSKVGAYRDIRSDYVRALSIVIRGGPLLVSELSAMLHIDAPCLLFGKVFVGGVGMAVAFM